jgi:PAS domain-containing protein
MAASEATEFQDCAMDDNTVPSQVENHLRLRALNRLGIPLDASSSRADATAALQALYHLALAPGKAADALALTHELQVQQVELEVQSEELLAERAALESALQRQTELYDRAPCAYFTVDQDLCLLEVNLMGARLLATQRAALVGRCLVPFLSGNGGDILRALLGRLESDSIVQGCHLSLTGPGGMRSTVHVCVSADSVRGRYLLACFDLGAQAADGEVPPRS